MTTPDPTPTPEVGEAKPLPLEKVYADEFYGVKVAELGEDGGAGFVAFTHDKRRALAALHRHARHHGIGRVETIELGEPIWWLVVDNCGCGDACSHLPEDPDDTPDCDCATYGLPPCRPQTYTWVGNDCPEGTPGALPVTRAEVILW